MNLKKIISFLALSFVFAWPELLFSQDDYQNWKNSPDQKIHSSLRKNSLFLSYSFDRAVPGVANLYYRLETQELYLHNSGNFNLFLLSKLFYQKENIRLEFGYLHRWPDDWQVFNNRTLIQFKSSFYLTPRLDFSAILQDYGAKSLRLYSEYQLSPSTFLSFGAFTYLDRDYGNPALYLRLDYVFSKLFQIRFLNIFPTATKERNMNRALHELQSESQENYQHFFLNF
jgi:hypothetical protein